MTSYSKMRLAMAHRFAQASGLLSSPMERTPSGKTVARLSIDMGACQPLPNISTLSFEKGVGFLTLAEKIGGQVADDFERTDTFLAYVASEAGTAVTGKDLDEARARDIYQDISSYQNRTGEFHPLVVIYIEMALNNMVHQATEAIGPDCAHIYLDEHRPTRPQRDVDDRDPQP